MSVVYRGLKFGGQGQYKSSSQFSQHVVLNRELKLSLDVVKCFQIHLMVTQSESNFKAFVVTDTDK